MLMSICEVIDKFSKDGDLDSFVKNLLPELGKIGVTSDVVQLAKALDVVKEAEEKVSALELGSVQGLGENISKLEKSLKVKPTSLNTVALDVTRDLPEGSHYRVRLEALLDKINNNVGNYTRLKGFSSNELLAMLIASDSVLDNMYSTLVGTQETLSDFTDKFRIQRDYKLDPAKMSEITGYLMNSTKGGRGDWASFVTDNMGNEFARIMGISIRDNVTGENLKKTKEAITEIGGLMLTMAEAEGLVDVVNINTGVFYRGGTNFPWAIGTKRLMDSISTLGEESSTITAELGLDRVKNAPVRERPSPNRNVKVAKQRFATAKEDLEKAVHNAESTTWGLDLEGWNELKKVAGITTVEDYTARETEIIDRLLPMVTKGIDFTRNNKGELEPVGKMVYDDRVARQSTLDGAERRLKDFIKFAFEQESNGNQDFWFNWFIARNDRLHIKSSTVNPQDDKYFARWLLRPKDSDYKVTIEGLKKVLKNFSENKDPTEGNQELGRETVFVLGLLQGFEGLTIGDVTIDSIDKMIGPDVAVAYKALMNADDSVIEAYLRDSPSHIGHAAMAYANYKKIKYGKVTEGAITANVVIEVDGLTNGLAFKMMQQVLGDTEKHFSVANATGIRQEEFTNMQDIKASGVEKDNYVKVGEGWNRGLTNTLGMWENFSATLSVIGYTFGDNADAKTIRNKAKPAVMVFMYGGSIINIVREFVDEELKGLMNHIISLDYSSEESTKSSLTSIRSLLEEVKDKASKGRFPEEKPADKAVVEASKLSIENLLEMDDKTLLKEVQKLGTESIEGSLFKHAFKPMYQYTHGTALEMSLKDVLGDWEATNNQVNAAMEYSTDMFMLFLRSEISQLNPSAFSEKVNNDIDRELVKMGSDFKPDMELVYSLISNGFSSLGVADQKAILAKLSDVMPSLKGKENDVNTALVLIKEEAKAPNDNAKARVQKLNTDNSPAEFRSFMVMNKVLFGPGAGTGAVGNHSQDSGTMVDTMNGFAAGKQPLNVWDAIILNGDQYSSIKDYNKNFYWRGVNYSMMQDVADIVRAVNSRVEDKKDLPEGVFSSRWQGKFHLENKPVNKEFVDGIIGLANNYEANREKMFNSSLSIGQMVGPVGTVYTNTLGGYKAYRNQDNDKKSYSSKVESNNPQEAEPSIAASASNMTTEAQNDIINNATTDGIANIFDCKD